MAIYRETMAQKRKKRVALALSSGGPRGFAYIGALEVLQERGYEVSAVAGTSIGALVGGVYAAGHLSEFKEWLFSLNTRSVFSLVDWSLSMNHLVKGEKIIEAIKQVVPDVKIEDMPLPFSAVATDLYTGEEVVFDRGDLFSAIRASMSIPSLFKPVQNGNTVLIDGHSSNCLPLNRVQRTKGDILVGFDLNYFDVEAIRHTIADVEQKTSDYEKLQMAKREEVKALATTINDNAEISMFDKLKALGAMGWEAMKEVRTFRENNIDTLPELAWEGNYYGLIDRTFSIMNQHNSRLMIELCKPDILVQMPFDAYGDISDYALAKEITEKGRELMSAALDLYESRPRRWWRK
ncbi:MAG: patatin-like phospholipase family protein [Alistipes sp.]|nr:patatin-like phospholipase family protein [Alistipes sp.]